MPVGLKRGGIAPPFRKLGGRKGLSGQFHVPAALPPGKTWCPFYRRLDGPWDRPASRESLYHTNIPVEIYIVSARILLFNSYLENVKIAIIEYLTLEGPCIIFCNIYTFQRDTHCSCTDCLLILRCQLYMFRTVTVRNM